MTLDRGAVPRWLHAVLALACIVAFCSSSHADEQLPSPENAEAKKHIEAGNKAFEAAQSDTDPEVQRRDFEEAILHYKAGAKLETKNVFTFYWNLGHAYRQLGAYTQADWFYRAFLDGAPSSLVLHREAAEKFIAQMRDEMARKATLMGPSEPAPAPLREPAPAADDVGHGRARQESRSRPWYRDRVGWVLVGGGAASALAGGALVMSGSGLYDEAAAEPRQSLARDLEDRGHGRVVLGAIIGGVGVAAIVAGAFKLAASERGAPPSGIEVSIGPASLSLRGAF